MAGRSARIKIVVVRMNENSNNRYSRVYAHGASNRSSKERKDLDFYGTDPECVKDLLDCEEFNNTIWEPACGNGLISETLKQAGFEVMTSDIIDRGHNDFTADYLRTKVRVDETPIDIITNPPYKYVLEFARKAISDVTQTGGNKVAMFLKLTFLETEKRYHFFKTYPPARIYVYARRRQCWRGGIEPQKPEKMVAYAWFIWEIGYTGEPIVRWIY